MKVITSNSFYKINDIEYTGGETPKSGIISLQAQYLTEFINNCKEGPYSILLTFQDINILYNDISTRKGLICKWLESKDFKDFILEKYDIEDINVEIQVSKSDNFKYMLCTYSAIQSYFNIPKNIKIYSSNSCVKEVENLPLGVDNPVLIDKIRKEKIKKKHGLLVGFAPHTMNRFVFRLFCAGLSVNNDFVTFVPNSIPMEDYYRLMAEHEFVLAPYGNGIDTYRLWEALYLGCTPIIDHDMQPYLDDFGVCRINSMMDLVDKEKLYYHREHHPIYPDSPYLSEDFYTEKIYAEFKNLHP